MNISVKQYAGHINVTPAAITKRIRENKWLPNVITIDTIGKTYVLKVKKDFFESKIN